MPLPNDTAPTVLIAEDERVIARRLQRLVGGMGLRCIGVASSADEMRRLLQEAPPDLLLLDIGLESPVAGMELAESGCIPADTALVFVSGNVEAETLDRMRSVGAAGFVVKPFSDPQVETAILVALSAQGRPERNTLRHATGALEEIAQVLQRFEHLLATGTATRSLGRLTSLTPREREVLNLRLADRSAGEIAAALHISPHTAKNHLKSIHKKLDVHSHAELVALVQDRQR